MALVTRRLISSGQARLDVGDGDLLVVGRQGGGQRGGRVAVHEHAFGPKRSEHAAQSGEDRAGDVGQSLARLHDVQVVVRRDVEQGEHLVEHLAMLRRDAHADVELRHAREALDDGRHLDGFGPRSEHDHGLHEDALELLREVGDAWASAAEGLLHGAK